MWYVYLLRCEDGSLYTGITTGLTRRMEAHRSGDGSKYVAARGYDRLLFAAQASSHGEAASQEHMVKQLSPSEKRAHFKYHDHLVYHYLP